LKELGIEGLKNPLYNRFKDKGKTYPLEKLFSNLYF